MKKCVQAMDDADAHFKKGKKDLAKRHYIRARSHYLGLSYAEKKEVYRDLKELHRKLSE